MSENCEWASCGLMIAPLDRMSEEIVRADHHRIHGLADLVHRKRNPGTVTVTTHNDLLRVICLGRQPSILYLRKGQEKTENFQD